MKNSNVYRIVFLAIILLGGFCRGQNQKVIDSLNQLLNTDISDRDKVDIYIHIATKYHVQDSANTALYANKAIGLAQEIGYVEGGIDPLFSIGYVNVFKGNFDVSERLFKKMEKLSDTKEYRKGKAQALFGLGWLNTYFGKNDTGLEYLLESLRLAEELGASELVSSNYGVMGIVYMKKADYRSAMEYYLKGLKINEELNNQSKIASSYTNIGIVLKNQGNYEEAFEFYMKASAIYQELGMKAHLASNYTNIGILYDLTSDSDKALEYQFKALEIRKELDIKKGIAYNYDNIAMVYMSQKLYPKALDYFTKALNTLEELGSNADRAFPMIQIGQIHRILNQPIKAKKFLEEGMELAQETGLLKRVAEAAEQLALLEEQLGDYENAYEAHVLYKKISDSLNNTETKREITKLSAEYDFQKEKDSLKLLQQQEILLLEEKNKRRENRSFAIAVCLILVLITGTVIYFALSKAKRTKELDALRNHISRDLHDEVGSTLSSLALFGTVARSSLKENPEKTVKLLNLINTNATETVESMNDIIWAINSDEDSIMSLINKMRGFANELQDTGRFSINIDYDDGISDKKLDMIQRRNLYLIFKEAINNAVKYSQSDTINVKIDSTGKLLGLDITDNGIGFELEQVLHHKHHLLSGNGLKNIQKRVEELKGELKISTEPGKGTKIALHFDPNKTPVSH